MKKEKVKKLLRLMGSENDSEALSALRALQRIIPDWHKWVDEVGGVEKPKSNSVFGANAMTEQEWFKQQQRDLNAFVFNANQWAADMARQQAQAQYVDPVKAATQAMKKGLRDEDK
jgi:hypothetical protein